MYVEPRRSNDFRKRREIPARDAGVPRSRTYQSPSASPTDDVTRAKRPIGGMPRGEASRGASARTRARSASSPRRQIRASGSTIQGATSLNAPMARSAGGSGSGALGSGTRKFGVIGSGGCAVMGRTLPVVSAAPAREAVARVDPLGHDDLLVAARHPGVGSELPPAEAAPGGVGETEAAGEPRASHLPVATGLAG